MLARKVKVLVVDDSAVARKVIAESLAADRDIEVVGAAADAFAAREKILALHPDVMTLDIEMPKMDGLTFLKLIMRHRPMAVVVMSSLTQEGSEKALEALQCGAIDVIGKSSEMFASLAEGSILVEKVKIAAQARLAGARPTSTPPPGLQFEAPAPSTNSRGLIVMGASTGGTEALKSVLMGLPGDLPPICIVQHIPAQFSGAFARRLDSLCAMEVREAKNGDELTPGLALVAPGGKHLLVRWNGWRYNAVVNDGPPVHHQRPAVDVLFDSVVKSGGGKNTVAALLTGMGSDGAAGLLHLREQGAHTIAQSEESCVVFGMPREAIRLGAAAQVLDLPDIAPEILREARRLNVHRVEVAA